MTKYRCVVFQSTGNYVPYSGMNPVAASDAFYEYSQAGCFVTMDRNDGEGWTNCMTYQPGRV